MASSKTHRASWKVFLSLDILLEEIFLPPFASWATQEVSLKKKKKEHDYKHAHIETQATRNVQRELSFLYKGGDAEYHKVFPLRTIQKAKPRKAFKAININAPCHCVLVWPETALDQFVLRVIFPHLQHTPSLFMHFSTLAQMTSSLIFPSTPSCAQFRSEMQIT